MWGLFLKRWLPILAVAAYIILPFDVLPDFFGPLGRADDLILLGLLTWYLVTGKYPWDLLGKGRQRASRPRQRKETRESSAEPEGASKDEGDPYAVLGLQPGASLDAIHRAYRRQVARYHPDRVSHLGEEFQRLAHQKFVRIKKAYDEIIEGRRVEP